MTIVFRTDASIQIGSGHVMRCLTLAEALRDRGAKVLFVCRDLPGNLNAMIEARGFDLCRLPAPGDHIAELNWNRHASWLGVDWSQDAAETLQCFHEVDKSCDWLVVDHYALDRQWEILMRPMAGKIMVIDDLADREHDCDVLLDQNLGRGAKAYQNLVQGNCILLVGLKYAILRPAFAELRPFSLARRSMPRVKRLLISVGGVDKDNITCRILELLSDCKLPENSEIIVVLGGNAPWKNQVRDTTKQMRWVTEVKVNVQNMAKLMADSDLAIGGAGSSSWERCALGLPSILVTLAENQREVAMELAERKAVVLLDEQNIRTSLTNAIDNMVLNPKVMSDIVTRSGSLLDGYGTRRVIKCLEEAL